METYHVPVLLKECIEALHLRPNGVVVDGTFGGGGHTRAMLDAEPSCRIVAFDADADAIAHGKLTFGDTGPVTFVHANFRDVKVRLYQLGIAGIDGLLLDLGVSSRQLDVPEKGFSYRYDAPLSMRLDERQTKTAWDVVHRTSERELARIIYEYGEERLSRRIARAVVQRREKKSIDTTAELAAVISSVIPARHVNKTLSRVFQAIRIEVNDELESLKTVLKDGTELLRPGGRAVVISYHSLEDRIVKAFFRAHGRGPEAMLNLLTKKPKTPSDEEMRMNPRARSAKLRVAEKKTETA